MKKVLFVCLGNICRSPLAKELAKKIAKENGLADSVFFDSCGTSDYHIGEQPDQRTVDNARQNGLIINHRARQFENSDFREFDYILAMDSANLSNIMKLDQTNEFGAKVYLMRDFDPEFPGEDVPDPYFGGSQGFQHVFDILTRSVSHFIDTELKE